MGGKGIGITSKRALINQANSSLVVVTGVAAFLVVFSLVASKTLFSQMAYQNRVLKEKHTTVNQLRSNLTAAKQLEISYKAFTSTSTNVIQGDPKGNGERDGDNTKIVLDALPSNYDFPALTTSLEKLITSVNGLKITNITGTDDQVAQSTNNSTGTPQDVPIPYTVGVSGSYQAVQDLVNKFEHSIRPFQIQTLELSGDQTNMTLLVTAQTFYQPAKNLTMGTKVVK
jgi:hypothetical protein